MTMADQQQQQPRGILPSETLNALDNLVDRLNFSSGRLPNNSHDDNNNDDAANPLPIRALLVGTNEGVGLSRSLGSAHTASQLRSNNSNSDSFSHSGSMSEEVLSSIETVWATLVSAAPPHVMAATAAAAANSSANTANGGGGGTDEEKKEDSVPTHIQPPHPLLSPLQLGDTIKTVTATYDNCTLIHIHMPPLVVTFVVLPEANIGAIRCMALPLLKVLLEPVRRALVRSRGGGAGGNTVLGSGNGAGQVMAGMDMGPGMMMEQMMAAGGMQQHHSQQQQQQQQFQQQQQMMFGQPQQPQLQQVYDQQQQQFQQQFQPQQQLLLQQQLLNQQMLLQQQQMYQDGNNLDPQQLYQQQLYMLQQQYQQQQQHQQQQQF